MSNKKQNGNDNKVNNSKENNRDNNKDNSKENNKNNHKENANLHNRNSLNHKSVNYIDKNKNKHAQVYQKQDFNKALLPLIFVIAILPLIMRMVRYKTNLSHYTWFPDEPKQLDFFLYYKHWSFVIAALIMLIVIVHRKFVKNKPLNYSTSFIPLAIYAFFALLSAIFSKYAYFSFHGSIDQQESVFALLGYCLLVYYAYIFIRSEDDIRVLIHALLISTIILSLIGLTQFMGHDFFSTRIGSRLVTGGASQLKSDSGRVYLTFFNPNYVGVYVSIVAPILLTLLLFSKNIKTSILYIIGLIGLILCEAGSQSIAGMIGIAAAVFAIILFMWRYLWKRYYITIPVFVVLILSVIIISVRTDNAMLKRMKTALGLQKNVMDLESIQTGDDKVTFHIKGNELNLSLVEEADSSFSFLITDQDNQNIPYTVDSNSGAYVVTDERFPEFYFMQLADMDYRSFQVTFKGSDWTFTNNYGDGTYYLLNRYQKWDKIYNPPATILSGYEMFATRRGYIWSRTLPLLKDHILLGSGPDTYILAFPQKDYVGFVNYLYNDEIITKPHNLYLQIAVQTGLLSLMAFLCFYAIYFITSVRLYWKGRFNSFYAQVGLACFIGSIAYMVAGMTNDSSITTAPVFWTILGIGIAANTKAKPLIQKEVEENKAQKQQA